MNNVLNSIQWQHNQSIFLIEGERFYTYAQLYEAVVSIQAEISIISNSALWFKATHCFNSYARLLASLLLGQKVFLCSATQYEDSEYFNWVKQETALDFCKVEGEKDFIIIKGKEIIQKLEQGKFVIRTSGSSGAKFKLVLHSPEKFVKKYIRIGKHFSRTFAFSPPESIAGVETLLEVITHQACLVSNFHNLKPEKLVDSLIVNEVDYFQTTPSYMNLLCVAGELSNLKNRKISQIAFGSEPSQLSVLVEFKNKLPGIKLVHTYGMSEIGILKTKTSIDDPRFFQLDDLINPFQIIDGILHVKSPCLMDRYLNASNEDSNLGEGWINTHDEVIIDGEYIRVIGREGDLINVGGRKFYPIELEDKIRQMDLVLDVTVSSESNSFVGNIIIATISISPGTDEMLFREMFKKFCDNSIVNYMHPHKIKIIRDLDLPPRLKKMRKA